MIDNGRTFNALMGKLRDCNMEAVFALLLAIARSTRHLEELHANLPANQQLLREDLITLREGWQSMEIAGGAQLSTPWVDSLLAAIPGSQIYNLTKYYLDALDAGRDDLGYTEFGLQTGDTRSVLSCQERYGHGYNHFLVHVAGHQFRLGCNFVNKEKEKKLVVRLVTYSGNLTEKLTYQLLSIPAIRQSKLARCGSYRGFGRTSYSTLGTEVDFYFVSDGSRFETLDAFTDFKPLEFQIAKPDDLVTNPKNFLPELAKMLKEHGLPFEQLMAIVPWSDECVPGTRFEEGAISAQYRVWGGIAA